MSYTLLTGDTRAKLRELPEASVQTVVTSPPYWGLRRYVGQGTDEEDHQIGLEPTPELHIGIELNHEYTLMAQERLEKERSVWEKAHGA